MFSTVKEIHIAIEMGLQHITSNRKQSIRGEYLDMAINLSMLKYIEEGLKPNQVGQGYEHDQVAYDEFSPLRKPTSLTVFYNSGNYYCILPNDYKHHVTSHTKLKFNRGGVTLTLAEDRKYIYSVPVTSVPSIKVDGKIFTNFALNYKGISITTAELDSIYSVDAKFMLVNTIFNKAYLLGGVELYWERYGETYVPSSFIIVSNEDLNIDQVTVTHSAEQFNSTKVAVILQRVNDTFNYQSPNIIGKSITKSYVPSNFFFKKNAHRSMNISIVNNTIVLPSDTIYKPVSVEMDYIKIPSFINYKTNSMSELKINDKIIKLAVQYLKALIKDEGYSQILNENKTI